MTVRDSLTPDVPSGLGRKIERPKPAPAPVPVGNGVVRDPDGRMRTDIAENELANIFPYGINPTGTARPFPTGNRCSEPDAPAWPVLKPGGL